MQFASILLLLSLLLSGCASYKASTLNRLPLESPSKEMANGTKPQKPKAAKVLVAAKVYDKEDCDKYLDRNVLKEDFIPIQITIENNSSHRLYFNTNSINMPIAPIDEVADSVHTSTLGRVTTYGVCALLVWPFAIPAIVDGFKSVSANKRLDKDFHAKVLSSTNIEPFSYLNGLIFIPKAYYKPDLVINLVDVASQKKIPIHMTLASLSTITGEQEEPAKSMDLADNESSEGGFWSSVKDFFTFS